MEKAARQLRGDAEEQGLDLKVSTEPITEKLLETLGR